MERGVFRGNLEEKQCAVFRHVLDGKKGREIAQALQISTKEVEQIVRRTCNQLGARSRMDAARAMAAHYRWTASPQLNDGNRRSITDSESAVARPDGVTKKAQASSTQQNRTPYLQNVGSFTPLRAGNADSLGKYVTLFRLDENQNSSGHGRRILLIMILVVGSTLALSVLISAMQGFNNLVSST
jgi:DNA-binding CsgD family transcriptional regulator